MHSSYLCPCQKSEFSPVGSRSQLIFGTLGSVLAEFPPRFPFQIWVRDITFVTVSGDKKCDVSHLSHFWE